MAEGSDMKRPAALAAIVGLLIAVASVWTAPVYGQAGRAIPADEKLAAERWAKEKRLESIAIIERKHMVVMSDGTRLATDIYRPKDTSKTYPIVFVSSPYNVNYWDVKLGAPADMGGLAGRPNDEDIIGWVSQGYVYVVQNQRGHFFSEGQPDHEKFTQDALDTFTWLAKQPWSSGRIASMGCSALGGWQPAVGAQGHPALKAMIPMSFGAGGIVGRYRNWGLTYRGGVYYNLMLVSTFEDQNRQKPLFPHDLGQKDLERLSKLYDLAPNWPPLDWEKAVRHLPVEDIFRSQDAPVGVLADVIDGKTPIVRRTPDSPEWKSSNNYWSDNQTFRTPALWYVSWMDHTVSGSLAMYNAVRAAAENRSIADNQYLIIGPNKHCSFMGSASANAVIGERDMGDTRYDYRKLDYLWMGRFLKDEKNPDFDKLPRVQYFTMGSNKWHSSQSWPPKEAVRKTFYLGSNGRANTAYGDGLLLAAPPKNDIADTFAYDPANPTPSLGGGVCCFGKGMVAGSFDQRTVEARGDVLTYSSPPLKEGMEFTGFIEPTIYISSDAKDTDITVKLIDVYPDGRAFNVDETIQRVRYREGYDRKVLMQPGGVYKVVVEPMATSNWFAPGHRIRIEVSSSNFPRFERNLNTGGNNYDEPAGVVARNSIHHSARYPSQIKVSVMPSGGRPLDPTQAGGIGRSR